MIRIGFGKDIHSFIIGKPLVLGGVTIPYLQGLDAYSDGDVVIHSVCDALLGSLSLGDIGVIFPNSDVVNKNRNSMEFLKIVNQMVKDRKYHINNIDISITCEEPKLSKYYENMRGSMALILGINIIQISVKAGTNEGLDAIGNKEGIESECVALVESD